MKKSAFPKPASLALCLAAVLSGCALGPEYQRPAVEVPAAYKHTWAGWKTAQPGGEQAASSWWQGYGDARLDALQTRAAAANQDILLAEARYRQARALSASTRSARYPQVGAFASADKGESGRAGSATQYDIGLEAAWEVDFWGRIKRSIESGDANEAASAADIAAARLAVQAAIADAYLQLRVLDTLQRLLDATVVAYEQSLKLTSNRYSVGLATRTEIAQAEAQLRSTRAQAIDNRVQRAQLEHAIALLLGDSPAHFALPALPFDHPEQVALPAVPASLPSQLLERRPDIAAAERRVAAANAQVGIARAAFFPTVTLSGNAGFQSSRLADLIALSSRAWALGPLLAVSVFDGGQRRAQNDAAVAAYDATVASYKQTVLTGFKEVEDQLVALRLLEEEAREQQAAIKFARESVQQTLNRYKAGTVDYLSVVTVQTTALAAERTALAVLGRKLSASVGLVRALGGDSRPASSGSSS